MKTRSLVNGHLLIVFVAALMGCSSTQGNGTEEIIKHPSPSLTTCPEKRPEVCAMIYRPVCGEDTQGKRQTFSSGCNACANPEIKGFISGKCEAQ